MENKEWKLLLVAQDESSLRFIDQLLSVSQKISYDIHWLPSGATTEIYLKENKVDAILVDCPSELDTTENFAVVTSLQQETPIFFLTSAEISLPTSDHFHQLDRASLNPAFLAYALVCELEQYKKQPSLGDPSQSSSIVTGQVNVEHVQTSSSARDSSTQNADQISSLLKNLSDGFLAIDTDWNLIFINQRAANNGNREPEELLGKKIWNEFPDLVNTEMYDYCHHVMQSRQPVSFDYPFPGQKKWYEVHVYPSPQGISMFWRDKTAQKLAEMERERIFSELKEAQQNAERAASEARQFSRTVRETNTRLEAILNSLNNAVIVYNNEGEIELANGYAIAMLGFDPVHMSRTNMMRRIKLLTREGEQYPIKDLPYKKAEQGDTILNVPMKLANPREREYTILTSAIPLYIGREKRGVVVIWSDVTSSVRLQNEIRQKSQQIESERAQHEAEQIEHQTQVEVQHHLIHHREMERIQIARDLHDGPLQDLIALNFGLAEAISMDSRDERLEKMHWIQESLQKEIRELRAYCNDLRPPVLAPFGLEKAIRSHVETIRQRYPDIAIRLNLMSDGKRLNEDVRMTIFRIYQELIANLIKHSHATIATIHLKMREQDLELVIQDNGVGFRLPENWIDIARKGHLGLLGVRERAESIGGTIEVFSSPGEGTRATLWIPLPKEEATSG